MRSAYKFALCCFGTALCSVSGSALTADQTVLKERLVTQADGTTALEYQEASLVTPGETVLYRLDFENDESEPVSDLVLTMPVPAVITFIEGSADQPGTLVVFSADQGATFSPRGKLRVTSSGNNDQLATADEITHIRWTLQTPVQPGETGTLSFKGVLK
mgnify:CR=1 FL=1